MDSTIHVTDATNMNKFNLNCKEMTRISYNKFEKQGLRKILTFHLLLEGQLRFRIANNLHTARITFKEVFNMILRPPLVFACMTLLLAAHVVKVDARSSTQSVKYTLKIGG